MPSNESFGLKFLAVACAVFLSLGLLSCSKGAEQPIESAEPDSTALTIALFPALDALPLMLANDWGVMDSLGVRASFNVYRSQMDAEKALAEGKADAAMSDMFRILWWQSQKKPVRAAFVTYRPLAIVTAKAQRISKPEQLDDRMIAISRFSADHYFMEEVIAQIPKRKGQILLPQINSVELRHKMLCQGQVEAAVLSRQQTYKAQLSGLKPLQIKPVSCDGFAVVAFNANSFKTGYKKKQMLMLSKAYDIAVERLGRMADISFVQFDTRRALFLDDGLDSLVSTTKDFKPTAPSASGAANKAAAWMGQQGFSLSADTLMLDL